MFNSRYSEMEMQQWQEACLNPMDSHVNASNSMSLDSAATTARPGSARASMAKGQAEKKQPRAAETTMQTPRQDHWASECLFDWYNS